MSRARVGWIIPLAVFGCLTGCSGETGTAANGSETEPVAADREHIDSAPQARLDAPRNARGGGRRAARNRDRTAQEAPLTPEAIEELQAIGYAQASDVDADATAEGVVTHVKGRACAGLNLLTSAHDAVAYLMDMDGNVAHTWRRPIDQVWPDYVRAPHVREQSMQHWRRVHLYSDGSLLAIHENIGILKLDKHSNLLWGFQNDCHHAMAVAEDGSVWVLGNNIKIDRRGNTDVWTREPIVFVLNPDGTERDRIDILQCIRNSIYEPLLDNMKPFGDIFHTNTLHILDGSQAPRSPIFQKGNLLICSRQLSCIAILDPAKRAAVWTLTGMWQGPHEPTLLDNGNMLIFDNRRYQGRSQVLEFHPFTQEIVWKYDGTRDRPLWSAACSLAQRLPNGNTLITETQGARVIEVTPEGEIVWEFHNTHEIEVDGKRKLANIHMCLRLPPGFDTSWLSPPPTAYAAAS